MSTFDGGASSYTGIPPARVRGVEVQRKVPVLPEPPVEMPPEIPDIVRRYLRWESQWGGTFPEFLVFRWLEKKGLEPDADFYFQCLAGHHLVLTENLRWTPVAKLQPGDRLLSFTESGPSRQWESSVVLANRSTIEEAYLVRLSDGAEVVCTAAHPWLSAVDGTKLGAGTGWRLTSDLRPGIEIPRYLEPWHEETSFDAGWVSGFYDGEGTVIQCPQSEHKGVQFAVRLGHNRGELTERLYRVLTAFDVPFKAYQYPEIQHHEKQDFIHIMGRTADRLRFLGRFRPQRLLAKLDIERLGTLRRTGKVTVEGVHSIGRHEIYHLAVSNGTFFADGFGMHNSSRMGGRQLYGGAVVDFDFPSERMAWRIQGEFFHIGNPVKEASDIMQKMSLSTVGYIVVDIFAQDVLERLDWVLTHAINGEQARSLHEGGS